MKPYCRSNFQGSIRCNETIPNAESIEQKMRKLQLTGEAIENIAPMVYTPREDGVQPQYDIRTDRWEIAQNAMEHASKGIRSRAAKREGVLNSNNEPKQEPQTNAE